MRGLLRSAIPPGSQTPATAIAPEGAHEGGLKIPADLSAATSGAMRWGQRTLQRNGLSLCEG